ncbi:MAG: TonB-dependent receptor plug domain-containing protein, partial [Caulobacteraceae bacterium]|nr:TonB-dependent receptor plug domain-containing protein [Caulobacter sp.]
MAQVGPRTPSLPNQGTPAASTDELKSPQNSAPEQGATATNAQPDSSAVQAADAAEASHEIVVTGVRASLERSIAIKRDSYGVVDAISAEDIGKFPDTNLAESLQRIPGVSIDRVNGIGSTVTVRGFGADYNLVTLNGRTLASSYDQAVGGDVNGDGAQGFGRSFDFSNIATEGVKTLEVFKTGRAAEPDGGIGAVINVVTRRPLDTNQTGFTGSLGVKADYFESASSCDHCGSVVTPDTTGYLSWASDDHRYGGAIFASYSQQHFSVPSANSEDWNVRTIDDFLNPANGLVNATTKVTNAPPSGTLVSFPNDSRYSFSDDEYERFNTQGVFQWRPIDSLTVTVDGLYVRNSEEERRSDDSNWFNRPFNNVTFNNVTGGVASATYLQEYIGGGTGAKDVDFENQDRGQLNQLGDYGINAKWQALDNLTLSFDG